MLDPLQIIPDEIYVRRELRYRGGATLTRRESFVPIVCPDCGHERWLSLPTARVAIQREQRCSSCAGKLKYQACIELHGKKKMRRKVLASIAARPLNRDERLVQNLLFEAIDPFDLSFAAQVIVEPFILDFAVYYEGRIVGVIEVNGWHHNQYRKGRDSRVLDLFQFAILFIDTVELRRDPLAVKGAIVAYLEGVQCGK